jgi:hypothetical protein
LLTPSYIEVIGSLEARIQSGGAFPAAFFKPGEGFPFRVS